MHTLRILAIVATAKLLTLPANALPRPANLHTPLEQHSDLDSATSPSLADLDPTQLDPTDFAIVLAKRQFARSDRGPLSQRPGFSNDISEQATLTTTSLTTVSIHTSFTTVLSRSSSTSSSTSTIKLSSTLASTKVSTTKSTGVTSHASSKTSVVSSKSKLSSALASTIASTTRSNAVTSHASSKTSVVTSSSTTAGVATNPTAIRGVNVGGWLILEKWLNPDVVENTAAVDQYTFDQTSGAQAKLEDHWSSYFTEADVQKIASWDINALRIPIGYWAYIDATPYLRGADAYLEQAIGWARAAGLKVLIDCHGSPGSQNGFDNSGHAGDVDWQSGNNLEKSINVLETIAEKYGSQDYADVVYAIELVNEPISWGANNFETTKAWAQEAYTAVKAKATNPDLMIIMHDGFEGPLAWENVGTILNGAKTPLSESKFAMDTHLYQNQVASDSELTQAEHIAEACAWSTSKLLPSSSNLPVYVGEFSMATNICANPDGTTVAGDVCTQSGCQCSSNVPIQYWNAPLIAATRKFFEAEMDVFEHSSNGWFLWSYKGPGAWGLENAVQYGLVGAKVTDRMYPGQCGFTS